MKTEVRSAAIAAAVAVLVTAPFADAARDQVRVVVKKVTKRGASGPSGSTGSTGATGPAGPGLDTASIRWRASSEHRPVRPGDGVVRLEAVCTGVSIAVDGGFLTGDDGRSISILGFERLSSSGSGREGYVIWAKARDGTGGGYPQVRAYCADAPERP